MILALGVDRLITFVSCSEWCLSVGLPAIRSHRGEFSHYRFVILQVAACRARFLESSHMPSKLRHQPAARGFGVDNSRTCHTLRRDARPLNVGRPRVPRTSPRTSSISPLWACLAAASWIVACDNFAFWRTFRR